MLNFPDGSLSKSISVFISQTDIAIKQNALEIKKAELKKEADVKKAIADAAYEIQKQEQQKSIEVARTNANIAKQEREVEFFKRQKEAEAKRYEEEQQALALKKKSEAEKYAADQKAEGIDKRAEAMKKMGEASIIEMLCQVSPKVAEAVARPLENVDSIVMYGDGNSTKMIKGIVNSTSQVMESLKVSTGIEPQALISWILGSKFANVPKNDTVKYEIPEMEKVNDVSNSEK